MTLAFLAGGILFTSMAKNNNKDFTTVTGTIRYQGNVPFEYPCIRTTDDKIYTISADEKTMKKIKANGTAVFEFTGTIIPNENDKLSFNGSKDGYFEVESVRIMKKQF